MQEALCSSVSLKACRVMQVLLNLVSPHLWNRTLTVNLSWPLASLSLSTCSERREADSRLEAGSVGSDMTCKKKSKQESSSAASASADVIYPVNTAAGALFFFPLTCVTEYGPNEARRLAGGE